MARMVPESLADADRAWTAGERQTFAWLERGIGDDSWVWFAPALHHGRPSVLLFGPYLGMVVLQVTDGLPERLFDPLGEARDHARTVLSELGRNPQLQCRSGPLLGRLKFPVGYGAVLPDVSRRALAPVDIEARRLLLADDIAAPPQSGSLETRLRDLHDAWFPPEAIGPREFEAVRRTLAPGFALPRPESVSLGLRHATSRTVEMLDRAQERVARQLEGGHRIIRGVAGSGKTRILIARAVHLCRTRPGSTVGILCYNLTLAAWIDATVRVLGPDVAARVRVSAFVPWAQALLDPRGIDVSDDYDSDMWPDTLAALLASGDITPPFDALMLDEVQDFRASWLRACVRAVRNPPGDLVVAGDGAQRIYDRGFTWREAGIDAVGRTTVLTRNYRNRRPIGLLARRFGDLAATTPGGTESLPSDDLDVMDLPGPTPQLWRFASLAEQAEFIAAECVRLHDHEDVHPGEIAVLYRTRSQAGADYLGPLRTALHRRGFPARWVAETPEAKARFPRRGSNATLCTYHSFKGLDVEAVFVTAPVLLNALPSEAGLLYVALTRARSRLYFTYVEATPLTEWLLEAAAGRGSPAERRDRLPLARLGLATVPLQAAQATEFAPLEEDDLLQLLACRRGEPATAAAVDGVLAALDRWGGDDVARTREAEHVRAALEGTATNGAGLAAGGARP